VRHRGSQSNGEKIAKLMLTFLMHVTGNLKSGTRRICKMNLNPVFTS
jgi:hypothetical protein